MRKLTCALLCLLMILSAVFCLAGCKSREQRLNEETAYEDAQMNVMNKKSLNALMKRIKKDSRSFSQRTLKMISKI